MPRQLLYRNYWKRLQSRRRRTGLGVAASFGGSVHIKRFVDYFPEVYGTLPEKIIFNELARRQINFFFSYEFGDIPFTFDKAERYRPDFILPDQRVIIDVQGLYWHSLPGKYDSDYLRAALLEASGYKVYLITDVEILDDVVAALNEIPEIVSTPYHGQKRYVGERPFNPVAPIAARLRKYPKVIRTKFKEKRRKRGSRGLEWKAGRPSTQGPKEPESLFTMSDFNQVYLEQVRQYGTAVRDYIQQLGTVFTQYPGTEAAYPEQYAFWKKWRYWWNKYQLYSDSERLS